MDLPPGSAPMRAYYLDRPLTDDELADVIEMMERPVEQARIPHVLPEETTGRNSEERSQSDIDAATGILRRARIEREYGRPSLFVLPFDMRWNFAFSEAIRILTGFYPYTIQTAEHRERCGVPGELRIVDMQGMMS
jgi:hypothetical protein